MDFHSKDFHVNAFFRILAMVVSGLLLRFRRCGVCWYRICRTNIQIPTWLLSQHTQGSCTPQGAFAAIYMKWQWQFLLDDTMFISPKRLRNMRTSVPFSKLVGTLRCQAPGTKLQVTNCRQTTGFTATGHRLQCYLPQAIGCNLHAASFLGCELKHHSIQQKNIILWSR